MWSVWYCCQSEVHNYFLAIFCLIEEFISGLGALYHLFNFIVIVVIEWFWRLIFNACSTATAEISRYGHGDCIIAFLKTDLLIANSTKVREEGCNICCHVNLLFSRIHYANTKRLPDFCIVEQSFFSGLKHYFLSVSVNSPSFSSTDTVYPWLSA